MLEFVDWLQSHEKIMHPASFAAEAHKNFVFIHPFIDGNGRVARLLMNLCLMRRGYTIGIIPPILRSEYINLLEKAHTDDRPFIKFIAARLLETQRDLLRLFGKAIDANQS
jgi:Fic family protein